MNPSPDPELDLDLADDDEKEISRVRAARSQIWESFGRDPYRLVNYYLQIQEEQQAARKLDAETKPADPE